MVYSLWDVFTKAMISFAIAAQLPIDTVIPQDINYTALVSSQITESRFSTDISKVGRVAAEEDEIPQLRVFLVNNDGCSATAPTHSYRLIVQNISPVTATSLVIQNKYPTHTQVVTSSPQAEVDGNNSIMVWRQDALAPGGILDYSFTLRGSQGEEWINFATVQYNDTNNRGPYVTSTQHILSNQCSDELSPTRPINENKLPAIICDPAETSCIPFLPNLGIRFGSAKSAVDAPILGKRFAEAVADIAPGECRVVGDDVISTPAYQDALNRQTNPAAFFMEPLFQSGQDFKRLVHENTILGIKNLQYSRTSLLKVHSAYWKRHIEILERVRNRSIEETQAKEQLENLLSNWQEKLIIAQQDLSGAYIAMQVERGQKFDPVAEKAIEQAKLSIQRACGTSSDGGLSTSLPGVKNFYTETLLSRNIAYGETQQSYQQLIPVVTLWLNKLYPALEILNTNGDTRALEEYIGTQGALEETTFNDGFEVYSRHEQQDREAFERVRLTSFEIALDSPKGVATACEAKKVFSAPVETSWCESGNYQELLGPSTLKARQDHPNALPPNVGLGGISVINPQAVKGRACSGLPGDPWWGKGCVCQCNQLVPTGRLDGNGQPIIETCQGIYPIILHDINVTSTAECLADRAPHGNEGQDPAPF